MGVVSGCEDDSSDVRSVGRKSPNGCDITKRATVDVNSIVSGRNYDIGILTSIIAKLLTSRRLEP